MYEKAAQKCSAKGYFVKCTLPLCILLTADEFEMSLDEFYMKSTNHAPPSSAFNSNPHGDDGDEKKKPEVDDEEKLESGGEVGKGGVDRVSHLSWVGVGFCLLQQV